jgi:ABC-type antimicrobial peptide transport system permease subunit
MSGAAIGALVGLVIGIGLSIYVARLDAQKRAAEMRVRVQYKGSLVIVPLILAGLGALIGGVIA